MRTLGFVKPFIFYMEELYAQVFSYYTMHAFLRPKILVAFDSIDGNWLRILYQVQAVRARKDEADR